MLDTEDRPVGPEAPRHRSPGRWLLVAAMVAVVAVMGTVLAAVGNDDNKQSDAVATPTTAPPDKTCPFTAAEVSAAMGITVTGPESSTDCYFGQGLPSAGMTYLPASTCTQEPLRDPGGLVYSGAVAGLGVDAYAAQDGTGLSFLVCDGDQPFSVFVNGLGDDWAAAHALARLVLNGALADAAVLTPEDVGAGRDIDEGWVAASPEQEAQRRADEDALADCLGTDVSELQADRATARSVFVSEDVGNPQYFASAATVYGSTADARVVLDRMGLPATQGCYREAIEQQILAGARDGLTSITGRSLSVDDVEVRSSTMGPLGLSYPRAEDRRYWPVTDDYHVFLIKVTLAAEDVEVDVHTALAFVTKGPVAVQLSVQTYFTGPRNLGSLAKQIFDRLPVDPEARVVGAPELPDPGEQPADAASAEEQVRLAYTGIFDSSSTREARSRFSERPTVWIAANQQVEEGEYAGYVEGMSAVVDEVVFISPTHAAVRFQLSRPGGSVPQSVDIGDAVLVDGRWLVGIDTTCALVSMAYVECDTSL